MAVYKEGDMFSKLVKAALPLVVLALIAAVTVGLNSSCLPQSITIQF
jgi:flagellar biosynthesis protein FliR